MLEIKSPSDPRRLMHTKQVTLPTPGRRVQLQRRLSLAPGRSGLEGCRKCMKRKANEEQMRHMHTKMHLHQVHEKEYEHHWGRPETTDRAVLSNIWSATPSDMVELVTLQIKTMSLKQYCDVCASPARDDLRRCGMCAPSIF